MSPRLELIAVPDMPLVGPGDDLAHLVAGCIERAGIGLHDGDVIVFAQKVISKAEDRFVDLRTVQPSPRAEELACQVKKDARLVEIILRESTGIIRQRKDVLITQHRLGFVMANAGVDQSNVAPGGNGEYALLLPEDPDASAARLCEDLSRYVGARLAVIVNDSFGRPWRRGAVGVAIGCAGLPALSDLRGRPDLFGRRLRVTEVGVADEIASAASLLMGQADEGLPVVIVRGVVAAGAPVPARALVRGPDEDLFR